MDVSDEAGAGQYHFDPATYLDMILAEVPAYRDLQRHLAEATTGIDAGNNLNHVVILHGQSASGQYLDEFERLRSGTFGPLHERQEAAPRSTRRPATAWTPRSPPMGRGQFWSKTSRTPRPAPTTSR